MVSGLFSTESLLVTQLTNTRTCLFPLRPYGTIVLLESILTFIERVSMARKRCKGSRGHLYADGLDHAPLLEQTYQPNQSS